MMESSNNDVDPNSGDNLVHLHESHSHSSFQDGNDDDDDESTEYEEEDMMGDGGGGVFFADATLEDAHQLVDTPNHTLVEEDEEEEDDDDVELNGKDGTADAASRNSSDAGDAMRHRRSRSRDSTDTNGGGTPIDADNNVNANNNSMGRITNQIFELDNQKVPARPPRIPRDISWALSAVIFIPFGLFLPFVVTHNHPDTFAAHPAHPGASHYYDPTGGNWNDAASTLRARYSTILPVLIATAMTCYMGKSLYSDPSSGGDGEEARHVAADRLSALGSLLALVSYPVLILFLITECPGANLAWPFGLYLSLCLYRDVVRYYRLSHWSSATPAPYTDMGRAASGNATTGNVESGGESRRNFFRALVCLSLDVLSRSLRRLSFYRILSAAIFLQTIIIFIWRSSLFTVLEVDPSQSSWVSFVRSAMIVMCLIAGKWLTSIVTRTLGLIASGGIMNWFRNQSSLIQLSEEMQPVSQSKSSTSSNAAAASLTKIDIITSNDNIQQHMVDEDLSDGGSLRRNNNNSAHGSNNNSAHGSVSAYSNDSNDPAELYISGGRPATSAAGYIRRKAAAVRARMSRNIRNGRSTNGSLRPGEMPEAYRTVDPRAYSSVSDYPDNDSDDEDDLHGMERNDTDYQFDWSSLGSSLGSLSGEGEKLHGTAKGFLIAAISTSFGSVAQCALLGGAAQVLWNILRNVDLIILKFQNSNRSSFNNMLGFQGMAVSIDRSNSSQSLWSAAQVACAKGHRLLRGFVRTHHDLAMCHVASHYKNYQKSALFVMALIDERSIEPILHDDITSAMCASVCLSIAGWIVIVIGVILSHSRGGYLSDTVVCDILVIAFGLCYILIYTVLEPLRSSVKAVYMSFAMYPESLERAFPLIYHRLVRISESRLGGDLSLNNNHEVAESDHMIV